MSKPGVDKDQIDFSPLEEPTCPYCEQPATTTLVDDTFTYGSGEDAVELHVQLPVRHCEACDFHFIDHVGERIQTEAVYRHHGLLSPWEIRAIRERRKLSRKAFAEITGLGEATIKRWETGAITQNRANDRYLRLLDDDSCWSALKRLVAPKSEPPPARAASTQRSRSTTSAPPAAAASP
ncbi:MAG: helix-turn-helix domain-containing protein [Chloroflexi bacterium]|nr:helix-turn-helix domain-containing protein [Chloroflexota bacterium]